MLSSTNEPSHEAGGASIRRPSLNHAPQDARPASNASSSSLGSNPPIENRSESRNSTTVTVTVSNVSFSVSPYRGQGMVFRSKHKPVTISPTGQPVAARDRVELLHGVSFIAKPRELTAIMGPSGCGKTTLLNLMSNRARGRIESGSIRYNGRELKGRRLQNVLHQVYANDKFLPYLTVSECLMFSAVLRLGQTTDKVRRARVEEVMDELALRHVADTCCGGSWRKGLSTGELRRLSIGMELIGNPQVLILDEPTSGLDAVLGYETIYMLKQVALRGRTVICSVHQPRSSIFELFDNLVLLGRGWCLYSGPATQAPLFFRDQLGLQLDQHRAVADSLIDLASDVKEPYPLRLQHSDSPSIADICERLERHEKTEMAAKAIRQPGQAIQVAHEFCGSRFHAALLDGIQQAESESLAEYGKDAKLGEQARNPFVQWWLEVYAVSTRAFFNNLRNPLAFGVLVLVQIIVGLFLGIICWRLPNKFVSRSDLIPMGDPGSPIMKIFNTSAVRMLTNGFDEEGTFPLLQMLVDGVDGNGSQPFTAFSQLEIWPRYARLPDCAFNTFAVEDTGMYPPTDLSEYNEYWADQELDVPGMVSSLMKALQLVDFAIYELAWSEVEYWARDIANSGLIPSYILPLQCTGISGDFFRTMGTCSVAYPDPVNKETMGTGGFCFSWSSFVSWYNSQHPPAARSSDADLLERGAANLPYLREPQELLRQTAHMPKVDPSRKLKTRKAVAERAAALPDQDAFAERAAPRRLQAGALMAGGLSGFLSFLPDAGIEMINRMGDYSTALRSCDHDFCRALDNSVNSSTLMSDVGAYGSVLVAILNIVGGSLFFAVVSIGFAAFDALVGYPQERVMFNRECANKMYHTSSYFIGKMIGDWIFQIVPVACLVILLFTMQEVYLGVENPVSLFFAYFGICLLTSWSCYGFAYLISAASPVMEISVTAAPLLLSLLMATSGFFVRDSAVPSGLTWMKYLSVFRWGYFALCLLRFPLGKSWMGLPNSFSLVVAGITEFSMAKCLWWVFGIGAVLRIIAFGFLKFVHRQYGIEQ